MAQLITDVTAQGVSAVLHSLLRNGGAPTAAYLLPTQLLVVRSETAHARALDEAAGVDAAMLVGVYSAEPRWCKLPPSKRFVSLIVSHADVVGEDLADALDELGDTQLAQVQSAMHPRGYMGVQPTWPAPTHAQIARLRAQLALAKPRGRGAVHEAMAQWLRGMAPTTTTNKPTNTNANTDTKGLHHE